MYELETGLSSLFIFAFDSSIVENHSMTLLHKLLRYVSEDT